MASIDSGDTGWMLISTALVMLMTPGLAFFYGGLVRRKNVLSIMMQCLMLVAVISSAVGGCSVTAWRSGPTTGVSSAV